MKRLYYIALSLFIFWATWAHFQPTKAKFFSAEEQIHFSYIYVYERNRAIGSDGAYFCMYTAENYGILMQEDAFLGLTMPVTDAPWHAYTCTYYADDFNPKPWGKNHKTTI